MAINNSINSQQALSPSDPVVFSSLTVSTNSTLGTVISGVWNGTVINAPYINYNTTNLQNSSNILNTIQNINTTAFPQFQGLTLSGSGSVVNLTNNVAIGSGGLTPINYNGLDSGSNSVFYGRIKAFIGSNTAGATSAQIFLSVQEGTGSLTDYFSIDGVSGYIGLLKTVNVTSLSASSIVLTDASKNLTSTSTLGLSNGGTNASLTASNGGIFYSTASAGAILAGTATAGQMLRSGTSAAPSWSTAVFASTYATNQVLYSSGANNVQGLTTANDGTLVTDGSGQPSISSTLPTAVQQNITQVASSGLTNTLLLANQPSFFSYANTNITNVTGDGTAYTVLFNTEKFDQNNNFSSPTFTAPNTGRYVFSINLKIANIAAAHTVGYSSLIVVGTSAGNYQFANLNPNATKDANGNLRFCGTVGPITMTASDTATIQLTVSGGTKTITLKGDSLTGEASTFSGFLEA